MSELVLTAYDIQNYLREALPALKAAIYRGDLSQAKDVLAQYDETIYDEYDLSQTLVENDYSGVFTEAAADPESVDPDGALIGLTYPLILAYHHPDLFHMRIGGSLGVKALEASRWQIQPGFREGLRTMWEITGYLTPAKTAELKEYCLSVVRERQLSEPVLRLLGQLANGLEAVVNSQYGIVIERD